MRQPPSSKSAHRESQRPACNTGRVPPALSESWPDMSMNKDTVETLAALATLATLPDLTPSQLFLVAVVLYLSKHDDSSDR